MCAVETASTPPARSRRRRERRADRRRAARERRGRRRLYWLTLAGVLGAALGLRLWGIAHGLPYAYNADENAHFVPGAIGLFGHGLNPHYFVNPPAYTYLLHVVFAVWFGGREGVSDTFATNPKHATRAVAQLRKAKPADPSLPLTRKLRACGAR